VVRLEWNHLTSLRPVFVGALQGSFTLAKHAGQTTLRLIAFETEALTGHPD